MGKFSEFIDPKFFYDITKIKEIIFSTGRPLKIQNTIKQWASD